MIIMMIIMIIISIMIIIMIIIPIRIIIIMTIIQNPYKIIGNHTSSSETQVKSYETIGKIIRNHNKPIGKPHEKIAIHLKIQEKPREDHRKPKAN